MGLSSKLSEAYPATTQSRLAKYVCLSDRQLGPDNWMTEPDLLRDTQIILSTWEMPYMDTKFLDAMPSLEAVFYAAGSIKSFATPEAFDRGITFCSAWTANALPVAEYAASTILLSLKQFWRYAARTSNTGAWTQDFLSAGAYRSTVGLLSLGAVGLRTAEMLMQSDVRIVAYDPYFSQQTANAMGIRLVSLEEVFAVSDVVSIHTPWLTTTEGLIDRRLISLMKKGATLINTSRGAVVKEEDLCDVLTERPDLTAILDVTYPEPPRCDSRLLALKNVIITPHIAGSVGGEVARLGDWMCDELESYVQNRQLRRQIRFEMFERMA